MKLRRSYVRTGVIVALVWAVILILGAILDRHAFTGTVFDVLLIVFGGFVIGWALATIACARGDSTSPS